MRSQPVFIVDNEMWYSELLQTGAIKNQDYNIHSFQTADECLANMNLQPALIAASISLPDMTAEKLLEKIRDLDADVPVILISTETDIDIAKNLIAKGATDVVLKSGTGREYLWNSIVKIIETEELKKKVDTLEEELGQKFTFSKIIIGQSPAIRKLFVFMEKAGKTNINVFITGEQGTGKELVAKAIHYNSERKGQPFIVFNASSIAPAQMESEIFGYNKTDSGIFKPGVLEQANQGTVFIDEITALDLNVQGRLLHALQEKELVRTGSAEKINLNVRVIAASDKKLQEEVKQGKFRQDLYYKIIGMPIELPPLRQRGNDILLLAKHFADDFGRINNMGVISITEEAKEKLLKYGYPGNIRELKSIIELAAALCNKNEIKANDIIYTELNREEMFITEPKSLRAYTCDIIKYFLKKNDNDVVATAKLLQIGKSTIYKMIQAGELQLLNGSTKSPGKSVNKW